MSYFAAMLARTGDRWRVDEAAIDDCESLADLGDALRDNAGDVRLLVIEQDDEYAAIVRLDDDADDPRAFLSDGHAADAYPMAAIVAEDLPEIGKDDDDEEDLLDGEALPAHDSAPFGDPDIVEDLGTSGGDLLGMCAHPGTLPVDLLVAVCEKAGCGPAFEDLRG
ncbi:MAG TPA: tRNA adenosine deaminase-associated protein [Jatrophihabitans sp.]|jgi:putative tRNA adenosine deaminase-associated protein|nr:tRNA adenosine deaminase-associated protein [Jatrophihabitans sp.]